MTLKKPFLIVAIWLTLAGTGGAMCVLTGMYLYLSPQLPPVDSLKDVKLQTPLRIYSSDEKLIAEFGEKRRTPITFDQIPKTYVDALLAAEDDNFFEHSGVSIKGLMRAVTQLLLTGRRASGGSTITMQVARNYYLSRRKTFARKFNEILLALRIEQELSKEEILELYVNVIFLGNRAYGIHAASQVYYGKPLSQLSLAQFAMLAGLPKGPSTMNPIANPERALTRRNWILGRMLALKMIDETEYTAAASEEISSSYHRGNVDVQAPYAAEMARAKAIELFGLNAYTEGYRIYTTVDSEMQNSAHNAVIKGLLTYDSRHGYRGPEQKLEPPKIPELGPTPINGTTSTSDSETASDKEQAIDPHPYIEAWLDQLKSIPTYGGLSPAAVILVSEQSITALTHEGETVEITWKQGLSSARAYINQDAVGPAPVTASDIVSVGDVIRLQINDIGEYSLSQVPNAQAALVSLKPDDGAILSLVGGFDFNQSHFNRATQAKRQPGSNFKPFVYTAALENGLTAASIINDAPIVLDDATMESTWRPKNSSGKFDGPTRLRKALYRSRNLVSIRVLREIGVGNTIRGMSRYGFNEDELPRDLSLALGSHGLTPLEVATGYAVFANGGYRVQPYLIERILDNTGKRVYEALPATVCRDCETDINTDTAAISQDRPTANASGPEFAKIEDDPFALTFNIKSLLGQLEPSDYPRAERVLDERVAYIINSMLQDVIRRGTGIRAKALGRYDLAGKTGTTNGPADAWFSGYNSEIVATTWLGFDQIAPIGQREYGGKAALPIWIDFMRTALAGKPETTREQPPGIVTVRIDPETGDRARAGDPDAIFEYFRTENTPEESEETSPTNLRYENEERLTEDLF
ncbi:penicillin-binding protein 1A [Teredinibacter haidensis]|uniref:penicillin-binding protein 1A n=1 Tax=Teredinibacter haidensis TaxID=2731755 RepID=UPI0009489430|nr:penicillin-binding protein 1A [Teredinibacter haidensis]